MDEAADSVTRAGSAAHALADELLDRRGERVLVTWLNHYSIQRVDWAAASAFDVIGIDGTLLQWRLRWSGVDVRRTSADLLIPVLLSALESPRVALVGAAPGVAQLAAERLDNVVFVSDGYAQLEALLRDVSPLIAQRPEVVIVGVGPGMQEQVARTLADAIGAGFVVTAGGWLDQLSRSGQYFPPLVHRLRLGWAWRLVREPRRLWRRYTVDAARFLRHHRRYIAPLARFGRPNAAQTVFVRNMMAS